MVQDANCHKQGVEKYEKNTMGYGRNGCVGRLVL